MAIKDQFNKIKENWLMLVLVLVVLVFMSGGSNVMTQSLNSAKYAMDDGFGAPMAEMARSYYPGGGDFAPEVEERVLTKTASLNTEVERGEFQSADTQFRNIVTTAGAFLLSDNVNLNGADRNQYYRGSYNLKVETSKYSSMVAQLKQIGEVQYFNENTQDITGSYTNTETEIEVEKERLVRYEEMYEEASKVEDKINLNDRIFNQERTIKYLEQRLENMDSRVDYSTISVTITEKRSDYANVVFVKFSELIRSFVGSMNNLFRLVFVLVPWAIALAVIGLFWRIFKKRR